MFSKKSILKTKIKYVNCSDKNKTCELVVTINSNHNIDDNTINEFSSMLNNVRVTTYEIEKDN